MFGVKPQTLSEVCYHRKVLTACWKFENTKRPPKLCTMFYRWKTLNHTMKLGKNHQGIFKFNSANFLTFSLVLTTRFWSTFVKEPLLDPLSAIAPDFMASWQVRVLWLVEIVYSLTTLILISVSNKKYFLAETKFKKIFVFTFSTFYRLSIF